MIKTLNKSNISSPQEPLWKETLELIKGDQDAGFPSGAKALEPMKGDVRAERA